jgi:hypothetical protein
MEGVLQVIPYNADLLTRRGIRSVVLRRAPAQSFLEDLIRGQLDLIDGFDTIQHEESTRPCLAFHGHRTYRDDSLQNILANFLWFKALLRVSPDGLVRAGKRTPYPLQGTIVVLHGDATFRSSLVFSLLDLELAQGREKF